MRIHLKKSFLLCLMWITLGNFLYAQTIISGIVRDTSSNPIAFVNVLIKPLNSNIIKDFTHTNQFGSYQISITDLGSFEISFTALGYKPHKINIDVGQNKIKNLNVTLQHEIFELNEIIVKASRPITVKNDTIVYDVKSFAQGNEQVIEDLLKKIPGLNISDDGTIKVGNQEVEKVMVDGEDFFEKGYKILTKNMPVSPVEKVELYQRYSNNKHLKSVENSDKVALNLTLKDDSKRKLFGNIELGFGFSDENRYEFRSNLMNFKKKGKYYFLSNLNNTGFDAVGDINHLIHPSSFNEPASLGDNQSAKSILRLTEILPSLKTRRMNFNNSKLLSLNNVFNLSSKTKIKTLLFVNSDKNFFFRNSLQSFAVGTTLFENVEDYQLQKNNLTGFGKIDLTHDFSKTKTLEITSKFSRSNKDNISNLTFNKDILSEKLNSNNLLIDEKIVFTNELTKTKVLVFSAKYIDEKLPQNYSLNQFLYQDLFSQNANNISQFSENFMQFLGFESHLLNRKTNGDLLEIQIGSQFRKDELNSIFQLKYNEKVIEEPTNYQNNVTYSTNDLYLKSSYRFKFKTTGFLTALNFHRLINTLDKNKNSQTQNIFFINPKLGFNWYINEKNKVQTSYSINTTNSTILEVYNNYINTSFRTFEKGNGTFNQLNSSSVQLNHEYGNLGDKFFMNTYSSYVKNYDFLSNSLYLYQNYSLSEKIIVKNRDFLVFSSNINYYLKSIFSNLKLTLEGSKSTYKNIVNQSDFREVETRNLNYGFELQSSTTLFLNYHLGSKWNYSDVRTKIKNSFNENMTFLDLLFTISKKINFQIQGERYYYNTENNNEYFFFDIEGHYTFKENKLAFSLIGNNLSNTKTFKNFSITDINISKTEFRLLPIYILLKIEYRY